MARAVYDSTINIVLDITIIIYYYYVTALSTVSCQNNTAGNCRMKSMLNASFIDCFTCQCVLKKLLTHSVLNA